MKGADTEARRGPVIRVLLADDHAVLREGVAALIESHPDLTVIGQAQNAEETVALCRSLRPDVAVIDISMPGDGIRAIESVTKTLPGTRTLALTMHDDAAYLRAVLAAGGSGYIVKGAASEDLIAAIRSVAAGRSYIQVSVGDEGLRVVSRGGSVPPPTKLSRREQEVLRRVAEGYTSREIAEQLGLKTKTVGTYRARLHDKLGVSSRADLVAYALQSGLLGSGAQQS